MSAVGPQFVAGRAGRRNHGLPRLADGGADGGGMIVGSRSTFGAIGVPVLALARGRGTTPERRPRPGAGAI